MIFFSRICIRQKMMADTDNVTGLKAWMASSGDMAIAPINKAANPRRDEKTGQL